MPNSHHILTVGISLPTNFARAGNVSVDDAAKQRKTIAGFSPAIFNCPAWLRCPCHVAVHIGTGSLRRKDFLGHARRLS